MTQTRLAGLWGPIFRTATFALICTHSIAFRLLAKDMCLESLIPKQP